MANPSCGLGNPEPTHCDLENRSYYVMTCSEGVTRANLSKSYIKALHKKYLNLMKIHFHLDCQKSHSFRFRFVKWECQDSLVQQRDLWISASCARTHIGIFSNFIFPVILPQNCSQTPKKTGVYEISNHGSDSFPVYCDQTSDGGGTSN